MPQRTPNLGQGAYPFSVNRMRGVQPPPSSAPGAAVGKVPSVQWTDSSGTGAGPWYYDLAHQRGRSVIFFQLYDNAANEYIPWDRAVPDATDPTNILRIWIAAQDPGTDRVSVYFF